jgi:beta-lactamase class A
MKLFVLLALLQRDQAGRLSLDSNLPVTNRFRSVVDGSEYALDPADDARNRSLRHVGESMHVRELARRMITKSSNLATNILDRASHAARVQAAARSVGAEHTRIVRGVQDLKAFDAGRVNVTTAHDLALVLEGLVYEVADGGDADNRLADAVAARSGANDMIPAGLPPGTDRPAQDRRDHRDPPRRGHRGPADQGLADPGVGFALVVMTRGFDDQAESAAIGHASRARLTNSCSRTE